jgi:hypothetical protein
VVLAAPAGTACPAVLQTVSAGRGGQTRPCVDSGGAVCACVGDGVSPAPGSCAWPARLLAVPAFRLGGLPPPPLVGRSTRGRMHTGVNCADRLQLPGRFAVGSPDNSPRRGCGCAWAGSRPRAARRAKGAAPRRGARKAPRCAARACKYYWRACHVTPRQRDGPTAHRRLRRVTRVPQHRDPYPTTPSACARRAVQEGARMARGPAPVVRCQRILHCAHRLAHGVTNLVASHAESVRDAPSRKKNARARAPVRSRDSIEPAAATDSRSRTPARSIGARRPVFAGQPAAACPHAPPSACIPPPTSTGGNARVWAAGAARAAGKGEVRPYDAAILYDAAMRQAGRGWGEGGDTIKGQTEDMARIAHTRLKRGKTGARPRDRRGAGAPGPDLSPPPARP